MIIQLNFCEAKVTEYNIERSDNNQFIYCTVTVLCKRCHPIVVVLFLFEGIQKSRYTYITCVHFYQFMAGIIQIHAREISGTVF